MMKSSQKLLLALILFAIIGFAGVSQTTYAPYYHAGDIDGSVDLAMSEVKAYLVDAGFEVIGQYNPEGNRNLGVIIFTRDDLKKEAIASRDRGIYSAIHRVGFVSKGGKTAVSFTNPYYFAYAYLQKDASKLKSLARINTDIKNALRKVGGPLKPFGGEITQKKLEKYRYMPAMEGFRNPVELNTFSSFRAGVSKITIDLKKKEGKSQLVYSIIDNKNQVAIFGVGLLDKNIGEPHFLPIIGEDHAAALPYEIVLVGKEATMLHGRFRIALHWPDLTMGTFTKIMSTPGDIKDQLKALTE